MKLWVGWLHTDAGWPFFGDVVAALPNHAVGIEADSGSIRSSVLPSATLSTIARRSPRISWPIVRTLTPVQWSPT